MAAQSRDALGAWKITVFRMPLNAGTLAPEWERRYVHSMTVQTLKEAIVGLPDGDRHSLAVWLNGLDCDEWDKQMAQDFSPGGRGAHLLDKVKAEIAAGKFRPVEELCAERQQKRG